MSYERFYRWLLLIYPREHRREYGELMVQLFLDRMRRDGRGLRGLGLWNQMVLDVVGSAYREHREGVEMTKRMWVGAALAVVMLAGVAGMTTILAQSKGVISVAVLEDSWTVTGPAADEIVQSLAGLDQAPIQIQVGEGGDAAEAVQQAVEDGVISQDLADTILQSIDERRSAEGGVSPLSVTVLEDSRAVTGPAADEIVQSLAGLDQAPIQIQIGEGGDVAEAVRQAVEDGVISQNLADTILQSLGGLHADRYSAKKDIKTN